MSKPAMHGEAPQARWLEGWQVWEVTGVPPRTVYIRARCRMDAIQLVQSRYVR